MSPRKTAVSESRVARLAVVLMVAACALTCSATWLPAQPTKSIRSIPSKPPQAKVEVQYTSRQDLGKGITFARLSNGMTVIVQENHSAPVATVRCYVHNTGSAYEGKDLGAGLSHVLEHLLAGGTTTKRTETQIRELIDSLGGQTNAYTSDEVTCFYINCPASGVSMATELIAQNMQHSVIPENEYKREMGVVQRELEMGEATRSTVQYLTMKQLVYQEHPKRHPTIGYQAVVQQITRKDVMDFYKNRYVPQNLVFVVVGDVRTNDVLNDVLENFKSFARTTERSVVLPEEPEQASPRSAKLQMEGPTVQLAVGWPTVALQHPDLYPLDVASFILTHGDSSRLVKRLKMDQPLVLSVSSFSNTPGNVKGWFQIAVECRPENVEKVRQIINEEIERLKTDLVTKEELARSKRQKAAEHVFGQQTVENQAEILADSYRATGDPLFDDRYVAGIQKVTPEQIREVARQYLVPTKLNTVLIEPLGKSGSDATNEKSSSAESPITKHVLQNGLTILLKRQSQLPTVAIQALVRGGAVSDSPEKAGLASLATDLMEKGAGKHSARQIAEYFDSIGGSLSLASQQNTSFLKCSVLKEDLDPSLGFVYDVLFHPTFPEDEFEKLQKTRVARIAGRVSEPRAEAMDFLSKQLPPDSAYGHTALGTVETVSKLTVADCKKYHETKFVPQNMVLAIFGDIDPPALLKKLEETFGKVPAREGFEWPKFPAEGTPLTADTSKHLQNQKKNTAMVLMAYPIVSVADVATRDKLEVLDGILTGGGSAGGRLHEELRGQQLVYYVFGIQMTGYAPGYFLFMAQSRPESVPEVISRIKANLANFSKEGIPAEEFDKIKAKLITAHALKNTTPAEKAFSAAVDELYGLGFNHEESYAARIAKVKIEDLQELVKKYFAHGLTVTTSPDAAPGQGGDTSASK